MNITFIFITNLFFLAFCVFPSSFSIQINGGGILNLRAALIKLRDNVLGVSKFQEHVNNAVNVDSMYLNTHDIVQEVSRTLSLKFKERIDAVNRLHKVAMDTYAKKIEWGTWRSCCEIRPETLKYNRKYGSKVNLTNLCKIEAKAATETNVIPNKAFLEAATENLHLHPGMKWQYFGSDTGVLTQFPATHSCRTTYDNRFRPWYVQASAPKPKDVILVIDRSMSMGQFGRIQAARESAITVLETLTPDDRVGVIAFSTDAYVLGTRKSQEYTSVPKYQGNSIVEIPATGCYNHTMVKAIPANIDHLAGIVRKMVPSGNTNFKKPLELAFDFLQEAYVRDMRQRRSNDTDDVTNSRDRVILFLSDGIPYDRPYDFLKVIQNRNKLLRNSVTLLCFVLGQASFGKVLQYMASQRIPFHDQSLDEMVQCQIDVDCRIPLPTPGLFFHVVTTKSLRSKMGLYYSFLSSHKPERKSGSKDSDNPVVWSVPYFDALGLGMVITAAAPVIIADKLMGVVGVDLTMHELMADVTYFREAGHLTYAFVMDYTGRVLIHPFLPEPLAVNDAPIITDIDAFERNAEVRTFLKDSLYHASRKVDASGEPITVDHVYSGVFSTTKVYPTVHEGVLVHDTKSRYSCSAIQWTDFMLCVVIEADVGSAFVLGSQQNPPDFKFLYHRFDLYPPPGQLICRNQGQTIAPNASAVMFSPSAFVDSGKYSETEETGSMVSKYIRYMTTGNYERNASSIFKSRIRDSVLASWKLEQIWSSSSSMSISDKKMLQHVVWRYFGSEDGVFRIFPGVTMPKLYNPVRRPWYEMAHALMLEYFTHHIPEQGSIPLGRKEIVAVSPPYLDVNGAGLVITLSSAIVEPGTGTVAEDKDERTPHILGVLGADIHLQYFEKLLVEQVVECNDSFGKCLVMDTSGYVIYDEYLMSNDKRAIHLANLSNYHIIHSHPDVAMVLINNQIMVRKKCMDVASVTFKTTYHIDLKELNKDKSLDFAISYVPGTNLILLSIPSDFRRFHVCTTHTFPSESCKPQVAGFQQGKPKGTGFDTHCESPCVDKYGVYEHYSRCKNLYNYSWWVDPPPCAPVKYQKGESKSSERNPFQKKFAKNLPECHGMPSLSDTYRRLPDHQNRLSAIFVGYVALSFCILVGVWIGLNKTRIRFYFRRMYSSITK